MRILVLAPHPFFQARGTPLAVRTVLEFLSARGHQIDVLTFHEGEDVEIANCRIYRTQRLPWIRDIRPGFSMKKVVCDAFMFAKCLRMVRKNRYDLIHAVEESAFIAAAMQSLTGVPYVYDMDSSLAEQMVEAYPGLHFTFPVLRRCEALAVRRSLGVLTVCAALEDVAHGHAPDKTVGRVEDTSLLAPEEHSGNGQGAETSLPPGVGGQSLVAMYVGNLERYQGIGLLIDGFRHTVARVPNAHLVIVGGLDQDIERYRRRAQQLGIVTKVHFLGPRPIASLNGLLQRADVLVSPRLKGLNTPAPRCWPPAFAAILRSSMTVPPTWWPRNPRPWATGWLTCSAIPTCVPGWPVRRRLTCSRSSLPPRRTGSWPRSTPGWNRKRPGPRREESVELAHAPASGHLRSVGATIEGGAMAVLTPR